MTTPSQRRNPKFWEQLKVVNENLPDEIKHPADGDETLIVAGPRGAGEDFDILPEYAYLERHVIVQGEDDEHEVHREIPQLVPDNEAACTMSRSDRTEVRRLYLGRDPGTDQSMHTLDIVDALNNRFGRRVATPDYLVSIAHTTHSDGVTLCPADEPIPAGNTPTPAYSASDAGRGVSVLVIDTGLVHDYKHGHPWLADIELSDSPLPKQEGHPIKVPPSDGRHQETGPDGYIRQYVGHGTFVAGVLKCVAPAVSVTVSNLFPMAGAQLDSTLGELVLNRLDEFEQETGSWPDIISLSAGTSTADDHELIGIRSLRDAVAGHEKTVLVAAAGNDGRDRPFWPAAYAGRFPEPVPGIVSVGALRQDGQGRACFSNHGDWVNVFAPGERLVNAFTTGTYRVEHSHLPECRYYKPALYPDCTCISPYQEGDLVEFNGMAQWSGTSFATPWFAGLIAAHMSRFEQVHGVKEHSREAANALLNERMWIRDLSAHLPIVR